MYLVGLLKKLFEKRPWSVWGWRGWQWEEKVWSTGKTAEKFYVDKGHLMQRGMWCDRIRPQRGEVKRVL